MPKVDDPAWLFENSLSLSALNLGDTYGSTSPTQKADLGQIARELLELAKTKQLDPNITTVLPFEKLVMGLKNSISMIRSVRSSLLWKNKRLIYEAFLRGDVKVLPLFLWSEMNKVIVAKKVRRLA